MTAENNLSKGKATIYALVDPRVSDPIERIRYIGSTTKTLRRRLSAHLSGARNGPASYHRLLWIRSLLAGGIEPEIVALETVPEIEWQQHERDAIAKYRGMGCLLVNSTDGGEGISNPSAEVRAKIGARNRVVSDAERQRRRAAMLGKTLSAEVRMKLSLAHRGIKTGPMSEEQRRKLSVSALGNKNSLGFRHSDETRSRVSRAKMGNSARLGQAHGDETKKKISKRLSGEGSGSAKLTWSQVRELRSRYGAGAKQIDLARAYGLNPSTVHSIAHRNTWIETSGA